MATCRSKKWNKDIGRGCSIFRLLQACFSCWTKASRIGSRLKPTLLQLVLVSNEVFSSWTKAFVLEERFSVEGSPLQEIFRPGGPIAKREPSGGSPGYECPVLRSAVGAALVPDSFQSFQNSVPRLWRSKLTVVGICPNRNRKPSASATGLTFGNGASGPRKLQNTRCHEIPEHRYCSAQRSKTVKAKIMSIISHDG